MTLIRRLSIVRAAVRRFLEDQGFVLAAALSFAGLLCLAPLLLIVLSAAGFLLESEAMANYLYESFVVLFPAYGAQIAEALSVLGDQRAVTGVLGTSGLIVFATQLSAMLRAVLNRAFRVRSRPLARAFVFDLMAVALMAAVAVVVSFGILAVSTLGDALLPAMSVTKDLGRLMFGVLIYLIGGAAIFAVYAVAPNTRVPRVIALKGTLVVAVLWEAARRLFSAYVATFGVYGTLYGSFGIAVASLVWIYYSAIIFVLGAELVAAATELRLAEAQEGWLDGPATSGEPLPVDARRERR